jgi:hypothetical protein
LFVASNLIGLMLTGIGALDFAGIKFEGNPKLFNPGKPLFTGLGNPLNGEFGLNDGCLSAACCCYLIVPCILARLLLIETGLTLSISSIGLLFS